MRFFAMRPTLLLIWIARLSLVLSLPFPFHKRSLNKSDLLNRRSRRSDGVIDCIYMASEEGTFTYKSDGSLNVCGVYFIAPPESLVELEFTHFNINCQTGLSVVVDGWEMNHQYFPSPQDHPTALDERLHNLCGQRPTKSYVSSQNVALIQHLIGMPGEGFTVRARFLKNPQPCNIVSMFKKGLYTVKNYGLRRNCSVSIIYPERIQLLSVDVGVSGYNKREEAEYGLRSKCHNFHGTDDHVEVAGGNGFEVGDLNVRARYCGMASNVGESEVIIGCQHSVVRLVSSGQYFNSVTFLYSNLSEDEIGREDPNKCIV
ncbi:corticotropin-releasing factor-binding protein-like [Ostrea edulis]|uniref:corticotropin-releasing factor-binding protein-like n=1 Tax=Ostrea edulis TaxID=37623 RepID=UPI0024AFC549|nr:corticotropin-releasing factor-binding protein-like [Ostrea edulis]